MPPTCQFSSNFMRWWRNCAQRNFTQGKISQQNYLRQNRQECHRGIHYEILRRLSRRRSLESYLTSKESRAVRRGLLEKCLSFFLALVTRCQPTILHARFLEKRIAAMRSAYSPLIESHCGGKGGLDFF